MNKNRPYQQPCLSLSHISYDGVILTSGSENEDVTVVSSEESGWTLDWN